MQPEFTGMEWYAAYGERAAEDGREGRLVAMHDFTGSWDSWEMHPHGDEVVICTGGRIELIQQMTAGSRQSVALEVGEYAINPAGIWHTADIDGSASAIFITAGLETAHRRR